MAIAAFGIMVSEFRRYSETQVYGITGSYKKGLWSQVEKRWRVLASGGNDNVANIWDGRLGDVWEGRKEGARGARGSVKGVIVLLSK